FYYEAIRRDAPVRLAAFAKSRHYIRTDKTFAQRQWTAPRFLSPLLKRSTYPKGFVYCYGLGFAFDENRVQLTANHPPFNGSEGRIGNQDSGAVILIQRFESGAKIDVVAHYGVTEAVERAHIPYDHWARIDAYSDLQR